MNAKEDTVGESLKIWTEHYVKHKSLFTRDLIEIIENSLDLYVIFKEKKQYYSIIPFLSGIEDILFHFKQAKLDHDLTAFTIVCFNTKKNFNILLANWNKFIAFPEISFIFVNPFSRTDKRWLVCPHFHARISDSNSLERGLQAMYSTVEETTQEFIERLHK